MNVPSQFPVLHHVWSTGCKCLKGKNYFLYFSWPYSLYLAWNSPHKNYMSNQFLLNP